MGKNTQDGWRLTGAAHAMADGCNPPSEVVVEDVQKPVSSVKSSPVGDEDWGEDGLRSADGPPPGVPGF